MSEFEASPDYMETMCIWNTLIGFNERFLKGGGMERLKVDQRNKREKGQGEYD